MATLELLTSLAARSVSEIASLSIARKMSSRPSPGALMDYDEAPPWKPPAKPKRAGVRTPLAAKRRNMRKAELRAVRWHSPRAKAISWDAFVGLINVKVGDRDVFDPGAVSAQELGTVLALTLAKKMAIEDKATALGRSKAFTRRDGQPYRFRIATIAACDKTAEESKQAYKARSNAATAAKRKAQRAEKFTTESHPMSAQQLGSFNSHAEAVEAQRAHATAQADALFNAIGTGEITIAELMMKVGRHPSWRNYSNDKERFYQAVVHRLGTLAGRIANRYEPRAQGGNLRLIRRSV